MARIIFGSHMFRYPLGGMQSWSLQYMLGLKDIGHEVFFFEKYGYPDSCYDPVKEVMSNDCTYGVKEAGSFLQRFGFTDHWCFVSFGEVYHGLSKKEVEDVFRTADLYLDMGSYGTWSEESMAVGMRILIEGEPGYTQIKMIEKSEKGDPFPGYDKYFTNGFNLGLRDNETPTAGIKWGHLFHPVKTSLFPVLPSVKGAAFTSIMNWRAQMPVEYNGRVYGQKDVEFLQFINLPAISPAPMEIALGGGAGAKEVPVDMIREHGWTVKNSRKVTLNFDLYRGYFSQSRGEFRVCKNVFVAFRTGWFSDVSAAYLASGRPVVAQDTGFSDHLPVGKGLFAVNTPEEAAEAIKEIEGNYFVHSNAAREIANEYLEAEKVMKTFMTKIGL
jgi:hypothetical protein